MTGEEAVTEGFATETITDEAEPVEMKLAPDKSVVMVNGYPVAARCMGRVPDNVPVMSTEEWAQMSTPKSARETPGSPVLNKKNGGKDMEIKNLDELRAAYPDLLAQAENAAQAKGVASERARIQGIEDIEAAIGDAEMVKFQSTHPARGATANFTKEQRVCLAQFAYLHKGKKAEHTKTNAPMLH